MHIFYFIKFDNFNNNFLFILCSMKKLLANTLILKRLIRLVPDSLALSLRVIILKITKLLPLNKLVNQKSKEYFKQCYKTK